MAPIISIPLDSPIHLSISIIIGDDNYKILPTWSVNLHLATAATTRATRAPRRRLQLFGSVAQLPRDGCGQCTGRRGNARPGGRTLKTIGKPWENYRKT